MRCVIPGSATRLTSALAAAFHLCALGCGRFAPHGPKNNAPVFEEIAAQAGIDFHHFTGATGAFYLPEIVGAGVALVDYDGDGDLDVFLVQGSSLDKTKTLAQALFPPPAGWKSGNRLFRNELIPSGRLQFTDVTEQAGVGAVAFGMGVAAGDYNNDGFPDLFVTNFGSTILYRNNGNGTFTDVTREAGVQDTAWNTSAAFCDYDGDGYLDLFVAHYVDFPVGSNPVCKNPADQRDYCGPKVFPSTSSRLFHNLRNGRFKDVSREAGITTASGAGLGVTCADFNRDGKLDFYVANDQHPNNLWLNNGDGTFEDIAVVAGSAYSSDGKAQSGMGVTAGDFDNDGAEDIFVTNLMGETNSLFHNDGRGIFEEVGVRFGLAVPSLSYTGFGTSWFDYDNDGYLDLIAVNGAVQAIASLRGTPYPYHQKNQLYHNLEGSRFADVSAEAGPAMQLSEVSRGAALGDINNDGYIDVLISNNNGPARLLMNQRSGRHYLIVRLEGAKTNRMGLGAEVLLLRPGKKPLLRRAHTDGSFLSSSDPRVHFGLGNDPRISGIVVRWTGGRKEVWRGISPDRIIDIKEETGLPWN